MEKIPLGDVDSIQFRSFRSVNRTLNANCSVDFSEIPYRIHIGILYTVWSVNRYEILQMVQFLHVGNIHKIKCEVIYQTQLKNLKKIIFF